MLAKRTWARMAPAGAEQVSKAKLALRIGPPAVREIILEVGLPLKTSEARLLIALRKAHDAAAVATAMDAGPTEAQTFDHLADVRTTAKRLASLLGVNEGRDIRGSQLPTFNAFCREAPAEDVLAVVAGVERLARWADNLKRQRPKKTPRIAVGTMLAVAMLPKIYEKHFDRKFGLTTTRNVNSRPTATPPSSGAKPLIKTSDRALRRGHGWTRDATPAIPIFLNAINALSANRGGVIVARDFAA